VQAKEGGNVELKRIVTHNLGDGVRFIAEWTNLVMESCKELFIQLQPNFIVYLKLVWHSVLIMVLLVLGIGLIQNILNLLVDVLDSFNEMGDFFGFTLCMGRFFHGSQWLKSQSHLKGVVVG
jgi:hypothetical protein